MQARWRQGTACGCIVHMFVKVFLYVSVRCFTLQREASTLSFFAHVLCMSTYKHKAITRMVPKNENGYKAALPR